MKKLALVLAGLSVSCAALAEPRMHVTCEETHKNVFKPKKAFTNVLYDGEMPLGSLTMQSLVDPTSKFQLTAASLGCSSVNMTATRTVVSSPEQSHVVQVRKTRMVDGMVPGKVKKTRVEEYKELVPVQEQQSQFQQSKSKDKAPAAPQMQEVTKTRVVEYEEDGMVPGQVEQEYFEDQTVVDQAASSTVEFGLITEAPACQAPAQAEAPVQDQNACSAQDQAQGAQAQAGQLQGAQAQAGQASQSQDQAQGLKQAPAAPVCTGDLVDLRLTKTKRFGDHNIDKMSSLTALSSDSTMNFMYHPGLQLHKELNVSCRVTYLSK